MNQAAAAKVIRSMKLPDGARWAKAAQTRPDYEEMLTRPWRRLNFFPSAYVASFPFVTMVHCDDIELTNDVLAKHARLRKTLGLDRSD